MAGLLSVIMLTLNEEENLPGALEHLRGWADEVFVVDSLSTDRTVDIALEAGAKVVQRPFTNFGDQWNFALHCLPISGVWTMKMDPDERLSVPLMQEITEALRSNQEIAAYSMERRLWFMGEPLHAMGEVLRIWRTGSCQFSDVLVNEHPIVEGRIQKLKGIMEHFDSPTLHHWFEKQNQYTTMEAIMRMRKDALAADAKWWGSALERRMFLKKIFYRIPFRYSLLWLYEFFYRQAYRDGRMGYSIPGTVIAVGVMVVAAQVDRLLMDWRWTHQTILGGSFGLLLAAFVVRFLMVAYSPIETGFQKNGRNLNEASRLLGHPPWRTLWLVELPLMKSALLAAFLLVFIDALKELPLTLFLRWGNFQTLSTEIYNYAKQMEVAEEAGLYALFLVSVGMIPVFVLEKLLGHQGER